MSIQPTLEETKRWEAVLNRDSRFDGEFVFAVRSTGIYCRPSCPSRRPRHEQVTFYAQPILARQAGYRPCLRCHPDDPSAPAEALVAQVRAYIDVHADERVTLADLSQVTGRSPFHLQRVFKQVTGISPRQYVAGRRLERLKVSLKQGQQVTEALYQAGYASSSQMYASAPAQLGMTPGAYQRGGKGVQIQYALVQSALGWLLVAYTERGVCMVALGDQDAPLEMALRDEYPQAALQRDAQGAHIWVKQVQDYLAGVLKQVDVPVDAPGTAFQWRVWQALRQIPFGSTRTYNEVAELLGAPGAARAVGHACATNPVALIIPCHRVVRTDGSLGGYRWGLTRKERLLAQEKAAGI
jgi:AraC family transcriptional regulator of adaptative response/methylated-DNA-[protein]-cysteine methyltransferase